MRWIAKAFGCLDGEPETGIIQSGGLKSLDELYH